MIVEKKLCGENTLQESISFIFRKAQLIHQKAIHSYANTYIHIYTYTYKNIHVFQREGVGCLSTLSYEEVETDVQQVNRLLLLPALFSLPAVGFRGIFSIIYSNV